MYDPQPGVVDRPPPGPLLDNNTGLRAIPSRTAILDEATGELVPSWDVGTKWELQARARALLPEQPRLSKCHRVRFSAAVDVRKAKASGRAFYGGLITCGLVWLCPVCAAKVQAVRALEVKAAIEEAQSRGLLVELATYTVPHHAGQALDDVRAGVVKAYQRMRSGRAYKKLAEEVGLVGTIRAEEVTWGEGSGWHPHLHVLRLRQPGRDGGLYGYYAPMLYALWAGAVRAVGGGETSAKAFNLQDAKAAAAYVSKLGIERYTWGAEDELVRWHSKRGRPGRLTPFDLLRASIEGVEGDWRGLWGAYAAVYRGQKQLHWSKGLRGLLAIEEGRSDEDVAASIGEDAEVLATLTDADWSLVRSAPPRTRGDLLLVAELHGAEGIENFLRSLRS